jgi:HAD superfamily hydrolase (TIGR01509 family)
MADTPNPLRAVLFDLMGVLLFVRRDWPGDAAVDAVDGLIGGVVDDDSFREKAKTQLDLPGAAFQTAIASIPEKYEPFSPLWDTLPVLRRKLKLGIINNGTRLTFPYFDAQLKFSERFDIVLSSGAEGVRKPDPEIYLRACSRLSVGPADCLFMDDSDSNISGAQAVGMQTILWKNRREGFRLFKARMKTEGFQL